MVLVGEGETLGLGDLDRVGVVDNPLVGETDTDGDDLAETLALAEVEASPALAAALRVALGERVGLGETDALSVAEAEAPLAATLRVTLGEPERLGEPETLRVTLRERVRLAETLKAPPSVGETLLDAARDADALADLVRDTITDAAKDGDGDGDAVPDGDSVSYVMLLMALLFLSAM